MSESPKPCWEIISYNPQNLRITMAAVTDKDETMRSVLKCNFPTAKLILCKFILCILY